jgi:hypothetical protein
VQLHAIAEKDDPHNILLESLEDSRDNTSHDNDEQHSFGPSEAVEGSGSASNSHSTGSSKKATKDSPPPKAKKPTTNALRSKKGKIHAQLNGLRARNKKNPTKRRI